MIPVCAYAQYIAPQLPRTAKDNFGGASLGGRVVLGATWADKDEYEHSRAIPSTLSHLSESELSLAGGLEFEISYLYGDEIFIGPKFVASLGSPYFLSVDVSAKLALPVTRSDAITISIGAGYALLSVFYPFLFYQTTNVIAVKYIPPLPDDLESAHVWSYPEDFDYVPEYFKNDIIPERLYGLYFPVQVGYEHVFESGFMMGISAEMKIGFKSTRIETYSLETSGNKRYHNHLANKDKLGLTASFVGVSLFLGYSVL